MIRLSVIVPFYNVERFAPETLRSLRVNAAPDIEFVLVDDASTDGTQALLTAAAERLPGAQVVTLTQNRGLSAARNAGLSASTGRALAFLDGDDVAAAGHFGQLADAIDALGCDFIRTDHVQVRGRARTLHQVAYGPRGVVRPPRSGIGPAGRINSVDAPHAWAGVYSRRLLDSGLLSFDEDLRTCEDRPWIWRLHLRAKSFAVVGLHGVRYRREVTESLTQLTDERQLDFIPAFERILATARADPEASDLVPKALRTYCAILCHHLNQLGRYPRQLRRQLKSRVASSLAQVPDMELRPVVVALDPGRAKTVMTVRAAA